jgi:hypothetical protein
MKNHEIALTLTPQKNSRDGYRLVESPVSLDPSQVLPTLLHTSPREISRYASTPPNTPFGPPVYTASVSDTAPGEAATQVNTHPNTELGLTQGYACRTLNLKYFHSIM